MAGMGIRSLELARAVGTRFDVRLLVPNDPAEAAAIVVAARAGKPADQIIRHPHTSEFQFGRKA